MVLKDGAKVTGIQCDMCAVTGDRGASPLIMRRELAKLGWTVIEEQDFCLNCKPETEKIMICEPAGL